MTFNDVASEFLFQMYKGVMWLRARRSKLSILDKVWAYPFVWLGFLLDVVYNIFFATVKYRDLPREFLFTSRLKRYKRMSLITRKDYLLYSEAVKICEILNKYDEGHC